MKRILLIGAMAAALAVASAPRAEAATILVFGQNGVANTVTATTNGANTQTTISGVNVAVTITAILAGVATPVSAFLNLSATSTNAAVVAAGNVTQNFSGTFGLTSGLGGTGTNYLS